jgi:hypothetical protein
MTEIIEPNEKLVQYFSICRNLWTEFDDQLGTFYNDDEWHYITSNIENNIFLLKRLGERGLLRENNKMVDCGIGLGTALFDFYLQSKELNFSFTFTGIEKYEKYTDYFKSNLLSMWEDGINLIEGDIMEQSFSDYNIVYSFTPFKTEEKLIEFYTKVANEISTGSIMIENRNNGLGYKNVLLSIDNLYSIEIDDILVFVKK